MGHSGVAQNFKEAKAGNGSIIFGREKTMSWITIYISGKTDFREEVRKKLEHSDQRYLQGYIESPRADMTHDLFWMDNRTNLRAFKDTIGAKVIWKHRIRFYTTLEDFMAAQEPLSENNFSVREQQMIEKMQFSFSDQVL